MALVLEGMQQWLREKYGWQPNQCGVQQDAQPSYDAGDFYVALDDAGVESGRPDTDSLKETFRVTVGIWRRPEHLQPDKRGILKLPTDKYLIGVHTLHRLERAVIVHKTVSGAIVENKFGFHNNWSFRTYLNTRFDLPGEYGAPFTGCLTYRGRSAMEVIGIDDSNSMQAWYGYRLQFMGLYRESKHRTTDDAIG